MEAAGRLIGAGAPTPPGDSGVPWQALDWCHPWMLPLRAVGQAVEDAVRRGVPLWQALNQVAPASARLVRFVPQSALPAGVAYELFIAQSGTCPTREGRHDFFNGLCWIHFPATKRRLNQLQAAHISTQGIRPQRGAVRDALTVLDENAAFLRAPAPVWDALRAKRWDQLFGPLRPLWQEAQLSLFGHALLEKLQTPRKAITAHVLPLPEPVRSTVDIDAWAAQHLDAALLAAKPFAHLPVLGVPGWWPANHDPDFYRDPAVFRPDRRSTGLSQ